MKFDIVRAAEYNKSSTLQFSPLQIVSVKVVNVRIDPLTGASAESHQDILTPIEKTMMLPIHSIRP